MKRIFTAFLAFAAFGCAAASAAPNPCALLSASDASKVLGGPVTQKTRGIECVYTLKGSGKNVFAAIESGAKASGDFNAWKSQGKAVGGLGAPAYFLAGSIVMMKGGTLVQVGMMTGASDMRTMNPKLAALAKQAYRRL